MSLFTSKVAVGKKNPAIFKIQNVHLYNGIFTVVSKSKQVLLSNQKNVTVLARARSPVRLE